MLALVFALAAATPTDIDVLRQVKAGKSLCVNPDPNSKTCSTIDRIVVGDDGTLSDTGETLIAPDKSITLETTTSVEIDGPTICGVVDMAQIRKGIVRVDGSPLPPERNALVIEKLDKVFQPLAGQRVCEGLRMIDGQLLKIGQAERVDLPLPGKPVAWISPDEGYRVGPRPRKM